MLAVRLAAGRRVPDVLALPVTADAVLRTVLPLDDEVAAEAAAQLADTAHTGRAGAVQALPRPLRTPRRLLLVGVGEEEQQPPAASTGSWRAAGAAVVRNSGRATSITFALPPDAEPELVQAVAEGAWLAAYRYRLAAESPDSQPKLERLTLLVDEPDRFGGALAAARAVVDATTLARDLTNTSSQTKTPAWFAKRIGEAAARHPGLTLTVRDPEELAAGGFGGILAVGSGSTRGPRLVELSWQPEGAHTHVVLVGKGITFDTGGICIKTREGMKLMRKDMAGAAAVSAATVGAAALGLPVRVTALAPLAENMVSGTAYRPGDVIRHYGGLTTEVLNTDAEGRVVLADALAYAAARLEPDVIVDLATLTGAATVALGKQTGAIYSENDAVAKALIDAGEAVGERLWRMPLIEDYVPAIASEVADFNNSADIGAGSVTAALFLREFVGAARDRWVHLDMSAPAWSDSADGELAKGATGFGVRTLLRWLATLD